MARLSEYSQEIAFEICDTIANTSRGINSICNSKEIYPTATTFYNWMNNHEELLKRYVRAKEDQAHLLADEILAIADDSRSDTEIRYTAQGEEYEVANTEWINRSKLRVDSRKWLASKLFPKVYGDRIQQDIDINNGIIKIKFEE